MFRNPHADGKLCTTDIESVQDLINLSLFSMFSGRNTRNTENYLPSYKINNHSFSQVDKRWDMYIK